ncbi:hypothetical protein KEM52_005783 [Ascosphaera acerosa]|nr:hypothetical protein KEM52_005783 [Ascosphaera acerosa]
MRVQNGGYRMPGWYNIAKLSPDVSVRTPATPLLRPPPTDRRRDARTQMTLEEFQRDEDERGLLASRDYIRSLIDGELAKGISPRRIILGGFSQGGALSIFTGMTHPEPLAGIFLLSSYVPLSQRIKDMLPAYDDGTWPAKRVPVFQAHGRADTIIPYRMGTACRDILEGLGMRVDFRAYTGLHHNINPDEMEDLTRWLMYVLPEERE